VGKVPKPAPASVWETHGPEHVEGHHGQYPAVKTD